MILFLVQIVSYLFPVHLFNLNRFTKISGYNLFFLYVKLNDNSVFYTHTGLIKSDNVKSFDVVIIYLEAFFVSFNIPSQRIRFSRICPKRTHGNHSRFSLTIRLGFSVANDSHKHTEYQNGTYNRLQHKSQNKSLGHDNDDGQGKRQHQYVYIILVYHLTGL